MSEEILLSTFTRLRQRLKFMALRFLNNSEDVEDQMQESFCRLWLRKEELHTSSEAEAVIVTTVKNLCIDTLRKRESARGYESETATVTAGGETVFYEDAERRYDAQEKLRIVEYLIEANLSVTQRQIIRMKEYEDKSIVEIACELSMQPEAVRMQLSRARKTIRTCYRTINER